MEVRTDLKRGLSNFTNSFRKRERNSDVAQYGSERVVNFITKTQSEYSRTPISEKNIYGDKK